MHNMMTETIEKQRPPKAILLVADLLAFGLSAAAGFASHATLTPEAAGRFLATWLSFYVAWLAFAPWLGIYRPPVADGARHLWRPALAALYAAPLGAVLRGLALRAPVVPLFVLIMAAANAVAVVLARGLLLLLMRWTGRSARSAER